MTRSVTSFFPRNDALLLLRFLPSALRLRGLWIIVLTSVGAALETLSVGLIVPAVTIITSENLSPKSSYLVWVIQQLSNPTKGQMLVYCLVVILVAYLFKALFLGYLAFKQAAFIYDVKTDFSRRLFSKYIHENYVFHLENNSAILIRNMTSEMQQVAGLLLTPALLFVTELMVLLSIACLLFYIEPFFASVLLMSTTGGLLIFQYLTRKHLVRWGCERQMYEGRRIQKAQEGLGGVKEVKLLGREEEFIRDYGEQTAKASRVESNQLAMSQIPRLWLETISVVGFALLIITILPHTATPSALLPTLALFGAAAFRLLPSANRILYAFQSLRYTEAVTQLLCSELSNEKVINPQASKKRLLFAESLMCENVCFTYPNAKNPTLTEISLNIVFGSCVGLIGKSGAGKSTLVDLLLGLLTPTQGRITVDGVDLSTNIRGWQDKVGYVQQNFFLADDTLRRNIAFGLAADQINDLALGRAIHSAQLTDFVNSLPAGLDTMVGERGVRLSGGQRQRIAIARALYHDPQVIVFDEATSALDSETEKDVLQSIAALKGTRTLVIIAHRLSTLEHCDVIHEIEHGVLRTTAEAYGVTASNRISLVAKASDGL